MEKKVVLNGTIDTLRSMIFSLGKVYSGRFSGKELYEGYGRMRTDTLGATYNPQYDQNPLAFEGSINVWIRRDGTATSREAQLIASKLPNGQLLFRARAYDEQWPDLEESWLLLLDELEVNGFLESDDTDEETKTRPYWVDVSEMTPEERVEKLLTNKHEDVLKPTEWKRWVLYIREWNTPEDELAKRQKIATSTFYNSIGIIKGKLAAAKLPWTDRSPGPPMEQRDEEELGGNNGSY